MSEKETVSRIRRDRAGNIASQNRPLYSEGYLEENWHWFHLRDTAGQERDFHFHDFDKLVILLGGKVRYLVENEDYALHPGEILLVRHHCIHKALIDLSEPYERIIVYLDRSFFGRVLPEARLLECFDRADRNSRHLLGTTPAQWDNISRVINAIEHSVGSGRGHQAMLDTLMMQLLLLVAELSPAAVVIDEERPLGNENQPTLPPDVSTGSKTRDHRPVYSDKIQDTMSYIIENLDSDLSVDRLAERVLLSRYHFMRIFRAQTGETVHAWVRQKRLLRAARLIRDGMPAAKAAVHCGFSDYSAFHRAFVNCFGCTPGSLKD